MLLESIQVRDFRNLSGSISLSNGLNILTGENGQGKTNWLEAVAVLSAARSFRTARLQDAIGFDKESAMVCGAVRSSPAIVRELRVLISTGAKTLLINDKKESINRYIGHLHVVIFNSDELEIVRGQPESRRRYLDSGIVSLHPPFVQVFSDYNRVIKQKNTLLQRAAERGLPLSKVTEMLEPWNEQLSKLAAKIHRARTRFVERVNEVLARHLFGREDLSVRYVSALEQKGDLSGYEELIRERLAIRVQAELAAGYCLIGPHRDDMETKFDGRDLRRFGSAGQQRSALLLLQLANISVFHSTRGEYPMFLIDDIDAELDYRRIGRLLEFLHDKTQTVITTSKESLVEKFGASARVFAVSDGKAEERTH